MVAPYHEQQVCQRIDPKNRDVAHHRDPLAAFVVQDG